MQGCIDNKNLKLSDLDLEFISANAGGKASKRNPERALVRHNFMEIFVRLAITRYVKTGLASGPTEAMQMLLDEFCLPYFEKFNCHAWRKRNLWIEEVDLVLKTGLTTLKAIYKKFSGKLAAPGAPKFMSLAEFTELVIDANCISEEFGTKSISVHYNLSMMT